MKPFSDAFKPWTDWGGYVTQLINLVKILLNQLESGRGKNSNSYLNDRYLRVNAKKMVALGVANHKPVGVWGSRAGPQLFVKILLHFCLLLLFYPEAS